MAIDSPFEILNVVNGFSIFITQSTQSEIISGRTVDVDFVSAAFEMLACATNKNIFTFPKATAMNSPLSRQELR